MNKITLIGNLTRDPELSTTPNGVSVCKFTIAVNRRFQKDASGEKVTDFFRITAWRQQAELCSRYLAKGRKVAVIGELQASAYIGNDGNARPSLDVALDELEFLTPKTDDNSMPQDRYTPSDNSQSHQGSQGETPAVGFIDVDDDTLPF